MSAALKTDMVMGPVDVLSAAIAGPHTHICQTSGWMFNEEVQAADLMARDKSAFFESPATSIIWPGEVGKRKEESALIYNRKFLSSREKQVIIADMKKAVGKLSKSITLIDEIAAVADEFVTNALFNAPFVDPVSHINRRVDRLTTMVDLPPDKPSRLFLAADERRIIVGIEDHYGSLDVKGLMERVRDCYTSGTPINFGAGGAGIGCFIIFKIGCSIYFGVRPGELTVIACVIPHPVNRRQRDQLPKHLHWIQA